MRTPLLAGAMLAAMALAACTPVAVSDFNGDSVKIQSPDRNHDAAEVRGEAQRMCATRGRSAQYASTVERYAPQYYSTTWDHLFVCV
ncbi:MAG: hypothetical protein Q4F71_05455 [Paracoccus sp. (in: a-proteobacteria)]|nr:hypothetical protein [Paracoccus sp. (in: a-proteobacteria)]